MGAKYRFARKSFENIHLYQSRYAEYEFACYFIKLRKSEEVWGLLALKKWSMCHLQDLNSEERLPPETVKEFLLNLFHCNTHHVPGEEVKLYASPFAQDMVHAVSEMKAHDSQTYINWYCITQFNRAKVSNQSFGLLWKFLQL